MRTGHAARLRSTWQRSILVAVQQATVDLSLSPVRAVLPWPRPGRSLHGEAGREGAVQVIAGVVRTPIARASSNDLMTMAVGEDAASMQVGAILVLDRTLDRQRYGARSRNVCAQCRGCVSAWSRRHGDAADRVGPTPISTSTTTSTPGAALRRVTSPRCWTWRLRPSRTRFRSIAHCGREGWLPTSRMTGARSCSSCITSSLMASEAWRHLPSSSTERQLRWTRIPGATTVALGPVCRRCKEPAARPSSASGRRAAGT